MFPRHCKEVSVKQVDFQLTEENIRGYLLGKSAYIRTRHFVFNHGDSWAVAAIEKEKVNGILHPIRSVDVVALPDETAFVDDPSLDVLSATMMGRLREETGAECVVVRGRSEHVSFFVRQEPLRVTVFDVVPPSPTKLVDLVEESLASHLQDLYVSYTVKVVDINEIAARHVGRSIVFPCKASGLRHADALGYLDGTPRLTEQEAREALLLGCSLSGRIFKAVYGVEADLESICPVDLLPAEGMSGAVLTKCCKVKEGHELLGSTAVVPWGARVSDVSSALKALADQMSN